MRLVDARCVALVAGQVPLVWREEEGQYFPSGEGAPHCSCDRGRLFAYVTQPSLRIGGWGGRAAGELALVVLREALGGGLAARLGGDVVALADEEGGIVRGEPVDVFEEAVAAPYSEQAQVRQYLGAPPPVVLPPTAGLPEIAPPARAACWTHPAPRSPFPLAPWTSPLRPAATL